MIVIQNEIEPAEMLKGINKLDYKNRRFILANIELDTNLHKNKVLLYNCVNKISEYPLTIEQRAVLINFYNQQVKFLKELN